MDGGDDYRKGLFVTEKDFLDWLHLHNVSVCDLGAETQSVLAKGLMVNRPSMSGCVGLPCDGNGPGCIGWPAGEGHGQSACNGGRRLSR